MLIYPEIDPVAIQLGPLKVHWYGLMYLAAFISCHWILRYRAIKTPETRPINPEQIGDLMFYIALGTVLGGRIGYVLFYNFSVFLSDPSILFKVWQGGMSFHGGFLGVLLAGWLYSRKIGTGFFRLTDFVIPGIPLGLMCGRIGNFINGELWGRPTDLPWGMVFQHVDDVARHPSMLYEALLEGPILFLMVWLFTMKPKPVTSVLGVFLLSYGTFRFAVEFVRQPDEHLGFLAFDWLTMGHLLSLPMMVLGIVFLVRAYSQKPANGINE